MALLSLGTCVGKQACSLVRSVPSHVPVSVIGSNILFSLLSVKLNSQFTPGHIDTVVDVHTLSRHSPQVLTSGFPGGGGGLYYTSLSEVMPAPALLLELQGNIGQWEMPECRHLRGSDI